MSDRDEFERIISAPPYERPISRFPDSSRWAGQYVAYAEQLAWEMWQAATERMRAQLASLSQALTEANRGAEQLAKRAEAAEAREKRLRETIENAPHARSCSHIYCHKAMPLGGICSDESRFHQNFGRGGISHAFVAGECNCWKRDALKEGE